MPKHSKSKHKRSKSVTGINRRFYSPRSSKPSLLATVLVVGTIGALTILFTKAATNCTSPSSPCTDAASEVGGKSWQLNFSDEFNGSNVDGAKWKTLRGGGAPNGPATGYPNYTERPYSSNENVFYKPDNPKLGGGAVTFTLSPENHSSGTSTYQYTSGLLQSGPTYSVGPPAYIESRIKVPQCYGCWSLFWMLSEPVGTWPPEFDIMEFHQYPVVSYQKLPYFDYHWPPPDSHLPPSPYGNTSTDYTGSYHIYGMYWDGKKAIPYIDGVAYTAKGANQNVTSASMYMIFQLSAARGYTVDGVKQMSIDWVRVWKPKVTTTTPSATPPPVVQPTPAVSNPPTSAETSPSTRTNKSGSATARLSNNNSNDVGNTVTTLDVANTNTPQLVSGTAELPEPTTSSANGETVIQKITAIDGVPIKPTSKIDTTRLTNGYHTLTIATPQEGGYTAHKKVKIYVNNQLTFFQQIRNHAASFWRSTYRLFTSSE